LLLREEHVLAASAYLSYARGFAGPSLLAKVLVSQVLRSSTTLPAKRHLRLSWCGAGALDAGWPGWPASNQLLRPLVLVLT